MIGVGNFYSEKRQSPSSGYYQNKLKGMLDDPGSFQGTPGFKFALDTGLESVNRAMGAKGFNGSGNLLSELMKYGTGLATQDYGSHIDRLGKLMGEENAYSLGSDRNALEGENINNQFSLGRERNANDRYSTDLNFLLGNKRTDNDYGLGMYRAGNDFALGREQNALSGQRDWWNYDLGSREANSRDKRLGVDILSKLKFF